MAKRVIVIGGGISGLTAAAELTDSEVILLEAQERFGGRIHTLNVDGNVVELGAEFVHGRSEALMQLIDSARQKILPASSQNQFHERGELRKVDIWGQLGRLMDAVDPKGRDEPFSTFLARQPMDEDSRRLMMAFVTGFNAANPDEISVHSLLRADYAEQMDGDKQAFLEHGYFPLIEFILKRCRNRGVTLINQAVVKRIGWKPGEVVVEAELGGKSETFVGNAAVVTVPLGVLKSKLIRIEPALPEKDEAVSQMDFGDVVKLSLVFRKAWWPEPNFGFIHTLDEPLQTWWSNPRGPVLTGWAGGENASPLLNQSHKELEHVAVEVLSRLFHAAPRFIQTELVSSHRHDWTKDPFFRGAYSSIPVDGLFLPKQLAAPVGNTLYFAGEATAMDAQLGTVFAALESGLRVAREMKESLADP